MQSGFKEPWPLSSTQHPQHQPLLPWQPSASPLLGKPKGFIRFIRYHSSKLLSSDPHRGGTRSRVDARGRQKRDPEIQTFRWSDEFLRKTVCAQMHVQVIPSDSQWVVNDPPTHYGALNGLVIHTFDDSSLSCLYTHYFRSGFSYWDSRFTIPVQVQNY